MTQTRHRPRASTSLADIGISVPKSTGARHRGRQGRQARRSTPTKLDDRARHRLHEGPRPVHRRGHHARASSTLIVATSSTAQTGTNGILTGRMTSDDTTLKDFTDQITQAQHAHDDRADAPEGAVRGDGDGAAATRRRSRPGSRARSPRCPRSMSLKHAARGRSTERSSSLPPNQEPSLATYAGNQTAAYQAAEHPHRSSRAARGHALRRLPALPLPVRLRDARGRPPTSQDRMRRAEAIIDELTVTLDHERGGEIASRLQGIYAFCRRHLIEAWREQDADQDRGGLRAARRAARGLGRDRRAVTLLRPPGPSSSRSPSASATLSRRRPLGRARRRSRRSACAPPQALGDAPGRGAAASRAPRSSCSARSTPACPPAAPSRSRSSATSTAARTAVRGYARRHSPPRRRLASTAAPSAAVGR